MKVLVDLTRINLFLAIATILGCHGDLAFAQSIPQEFVGSFTDSKKGCPSQDGFMQVTNRGYTTLMTRKTKEGKYIVDKHECKITKFDKPPSDPKNFQFSCIAIFKDSSRMRAEFAEENWKIDAGGNLVINGRYKYRRCE